MGLKEYKDKRDFRKTPEPEGRGDASPSGRLYVIQKHAASRLHYDLRLELGGYLKSWAVPKGPSLVAGEKRLAVQVEDHPIGYGTFEGIIPEGEYGGGTVMLWDRGEWKPEGDPEDEYARGRLHFELFGEKLRGSWALARMGGEGKDWLLIKRRDAFARKRDAFTGKSDRSVLTGRTMKEIAAAKDAVWQEGGIVRPPPAESVAGPESFAPSIKKIPFDPSTLTRAVRGDIPADLKPQLAILADTPPEGDEWLHEIKYDGYRLMARITGGTVRLISRNGKDWTGRFSDLADDLTNLPPADAVLDGEIVVQRPDGTTDFQALQNHLQGIPSGKLLFYLFDILYFGGYDLTNSPLSERKDLLRRLLDQMPPGPATLRYSDHIEGKGGAVYRHACRFILEGIISKRRDSPYQQKRNRSWIKVKCQSRQEFVIGGYTPPSGGRTGFGALLLGYYNGESSLHYCGKVGTGFTESLLKSLTARLEALRSETPLFENPPIGREARDIRWVRPELVAEVEFTAWTREGILRHPSFKGLREDKPAAEVRREAGGMFPSREIRSTVAGVRLTHPERVLYPDQGITKFALARYYEKVADHILPHLIHRPLTLVRCPRGAEKTCFYQKHFEEDVPDNLRGVLVRESDGEGMYAVADDLKGLIRLVQMGVLEIHLWNSREEKLEFPDMMIFDLDPGPGVAWERVVWAALRLRDTLSGIGLRSFLKTSGGKGFHVVVPLVPESGWDAVKNFSREVAENLVRRHPDRFVATMSKKEREGKIFIDYMRNGRGATTVAVYSTRAATGAPVSAPIGWDELSPGLKANAFNIDNLPARLSSMGEDPWKDFLRVSQSIPRPG